MKKCPAQIVFTQFLLVKLGKSINCHSTASKSQVIKKLIFSVQLRGIRCVPRMDVQLRGIMCFQNGDEGIKSCTRQVTLLYGRLLGEAFPVGSVAKVH